MPPSNVVHLGQLLSMSYTFCTRAWKPILIGALVFGTIAALLQGTLNIKAQYKSMSMMENMGVDMEKMQELSTRISMGDASAGEELRLMMEGEFGDMSEEEMSAYAANLSKNVFFEMSPILALSFLISFLLSVLAGAYYLVLAVHSEKDPQKAAGRLPKLYFPLLGISIWTFLRSFVWIPVLGIIPAIILGPRFVAAPLIHMQEKKGVLASVSESYRRTNGYWGKIIGNMIVMCVCLAVVSIVVGIVASFFGVISPWLTDWIVSVMSYVLMAYAVVFTVQLSLTVFANPLGKLSPEPLKATVKATATRPTAKKTSKK